MQNMIHILYNIYICDPYNLKVDPYLIHLSVISSYNYTPHLVMVKVHISLDLLKRSRKKPSSRFPVMD